MILPAQLERPLALQPLGKARVWGGDRLARRLGREVVGTGPLGESWELYHRPEGSSRVARGPLAGRSLDELLARNPAAILGGPEPAAVGVPFPLVIKWLDASARLSLQVHPGEAFARRVAGDGGKNEAWVVREADPGAWVVRGLDGCAGADEVRRAVGAGRLERFLRPFPVSPGDVVWLPAGTVHAMGGGLLVYEVQSNSDVTYRLHDWDRLGLDGRPRELHFEQALEVIDFSLAEETLHPVVEIGPGRRLLAECSDFRLESIDPALAGELDGRGSFLVVTACFGRVRLAGELVLEAGDTALVPAAAGPVAAEPLAEECLLLVTGPGGRDRG